MSNIKVLAPLFGALQKAHEMPRVSRIALLSGALIVMTGLFVSVHTSALNASLAPQAASAASATCTPNTSYQLPAAVDLTSAKSGVTVVSDPTAYYDVYGTSVGDMTNQLNQCAPKFQGANTSADYLAYTSYNLSWQYSYTQDSDGLCRLTNIKVGLHTSQIFPRWDSGSTASSALNTKWQSFISGTETHENGHLAIDEQYANDLLTELKSQPAMSCSSLTQTITTLTKQTSTALIAANHDHDTQTDYGRDQGAEW